MIEKNTFVKNIGSFADETRLEPRGTNFRRRKLGDKKSIVKKKALSTEMWQIKAEIEHHFRCQKKQKFLRLAQSSKLNLKQSAAKKHPNGTKINLWDRKKIAIIPSYVHLSQSLIGDPLSLVILKIQTLGKQEQSQLFSERRYEKLFCWCRRRVWEHKNKWYVFSSKEKIWLHLETET